MRLVVHSNSVLFTQLQIFFIAPWHFIFTILQNITARVKRCKQFSTKFEFACLIGFNAPCCILTTFMSYRRLTQQFFITLWCWLSCELISLFLGHFLLLCQCEYADVFSSRSHNWDRHGRGFCREQKVLHKNSLERNLMFVSSVSWHVKTRLFGCGIFVVI